MSRGDDGVINAAGQGADARELDVMGDPQFDEVKAALGLAVAPVTPSAAAKDALMERIAVTPQLAPLAPARPAERRAQSRWFSRPALLAAAVAAAVAVFFSGVVAADVLRPSGPGDDDRLALIVAAPDVSTLVSAVSGGGSATLVASESLGLSALVVDGLEPLAADERYALWYITDGVATPAGLFAVEGDGATVQVLDGAFEAGTVVGLTVEPATGSPAPTSDPIVAIATA